MWLLCMCSYCKMIQADWGSEILCFILFFCCSFPSCVESILWMYVLWILNCYFDVIILINISIQITLLKAEKHSQNVDMRRSWAFGISH